MSARTHAWIDDSLAQLERMEEEHAGLIDALEDIERRTSELSRNVDETDALLDTLEDEASTVNVTRIELEGRRAMLARRQAALWDRLLDLWKEWESVKGSQRALALEEGRLEERSRSLPEKLSSAEFRRRTLEHQLASLHRLRREVATEAAKLEVEKTRMFRALERVADQEEERARDRARMREREGSGLRTAPLRLVPPPPPPPSLRMPRPHRLEHELPRHAGAPEPIRAQPPAPLHIVALELDPTPSGLTEVPVSDGVPILLGDRPSSDGVPTPFDDRPVSGGVPTFEERTVSGGVPTPFDQPAVTDEVFFDPGRDPNRSSEILLKVGPGQRKWIGALTGAFERLPAVTSWPSSRSLRLAAAFGVPMIVVAWWGLQGTPRSTETLPSTAAASVLILAAEVEPERDEPSSGPRVLRTPPTFAEADEDDDDDAARKAPRKPGQGVRGRRPAVARKTAASSEPEPSRAKLSTAIGNDPLSGI